MGPLGLPAGPVEEARLVTRHLGAVSEMACSELWEAPRGLQLSSKPTGTSALPATLGQGAHQQIPAPSWKGCSPSPGGQTLGNQAPAQWPLTSRRASLICGGVHKAVLSTGVTWSSSQGTDT